MGEVALYTLLYRMFVAVDTPLEMAREPRGDAVQNVHHLKCLQDLKGVVRKFPRWVGRTGVPRLYDPPPPPRITIGP